MSGVPDQAVSRASAARVPRFRPAILGVAIAGAGLVWWLGPGAVQRGARERAAAAVASEAKDGAGSPAKTGAGREEPPRRGGSSDRPVPVQAARARTSDVPLTQAGLGTVIPSQSVVVRSRVSGQLLRVLFKEGQQVRAGQVLAEIDPRPFRAQLEQVEGQLARDRALLKNAELDLQRLRSVASEVIAKQQIDAQESLVHQYEGAVRSDQGLVDAAELQVSFTRITAPIAGRIGLRLVDGGNYINAGDPAGIAIITAVQPICVTFSLPEDRVPGVLARLSQLRRRGGALSVEAWDRDGRRRLATGTLLTLDNQIDPSTGTVKLKGQFANDDGALFPNQFVNARLLLDVLRGATTVPYTAIQHGNQGSFAYAVDADNVVAVRQVALGPSDGENVAIEHGLAPGDLVVTNGVDKLREGSRVQVVGGASSSSSPPAGRRLADRRGPAAPAP